MNNTSINIIAPSQNIQQCVDVIQLEKAYELNNIVSGLFYQKIINNLYWFFAIGLFLLNITFIIYHIRQKPIQDYAKPFYDKDNIILSAMFLFFIGTNAMTIFLKTFSFGDDILMLIPFIIIWGINFIMSFYNFIMFFMPIGIKFIDRIQKMRD